MCQSQQKGQDSKLNKWIGQGSQMPCTSIFIRDFDILWLFPDNRLIAQTN